MTFCINCHTKKILFLYLYVLNGNLKHICIILGLEWFRSTGVMFILAWLYIITWLVYCSTVKYQPKQPHGSMFMFNVNYNYCD